MAVASITCRAFTVLRHEITRGFSVGSLATPKRYRNLTLYKETSSRRWWSIPQRELSTTQPIFTPTISPILNKKTNENTNSKLHKVSSSESEIRREILEPDSTTITGVTVDFHRGFPRITVPLPSRKEKCIFTLKPITNSVGDFIDMLMIEDRGIDRACLTATDGTRISRCNKIESILDADFKLIINDVTYDVSPPNQERYTLETVDKLSDVQVMISQLYETLHCQEYNSILESEVLAELEQIMMELEPLELKKQELEVTASKRANFYAWTLLVIMAIQAGLLARFTWWDYSWDIMEPVTYFVTYSTSMLCYAYFIITRQEYMLPDVMNRRYLIAFHKRARAAGLDLDRYNFLKEQAHDLETTLRIIRGPLWNHKNKVEKKLQEKMRLSSSSSSSSSRSPSSSPSPSPCPSPQHNKQHT